MRYDVAKKHEAAILGFLGGQTVQYKKPDGSWQDIDNPTFASSVDTYRVKPESFLPIYRYSPADGNSKSGELYTGASWNALSSARVAGSPSAIGVLRLSSDASGKIIAEVVPNE